MADYIFMMESRLTPEQQRGVNLVTEVARSHDMNVYLVGGVVRDIISGSAIRDLDFAVQGNALKLQRDLEKAGAVVTGVDEPLKTLYVNMPGNLRGEIASTRSEVYDKPGKPPEISTATIHEDLRRRDFSINAMALSLNPGSRGLLLDPFNGVADIESKLVRILHNYSFLEDPSRMLRATRFMARYEWQLEERTKARYDAAKEGEYIEHASKRLLGHEIEQIAHENDPLKVMKALDKEGWLKVLFSRWTTAKVDVPGLNHLLKSRTQMQMLGYTLDSGAAAMYFLTGRMSGADVTALQVLIPRKSFVQEWKRLEDDAKELAKRLTSKEASVPSLAWKLLSTVRPETILFALETSRVKAAVKKIDNFLGKWRQVRTRFPLPEMAELRITPELPEYPRLVDDMFLLMLDGKLRSHNEIVKFLTPFSPPEPPPPPPPPKRLKMKKATKAKATKGAAAPAPPAEPEEVDVEKLLSEADTLSLADEEAPEADLEDDMDDEDEGDEGEAPVKKKGAASEKKATARKPAPKAAVKKPSKPAPKKPAKKVASKKKKK